MAQTENNSKKTNLWFGEGQRYAQVPATVLMDSRLAPRHLQILLVLMLHVNRVSGICDVSRETIADYTGFNIGTISTAIIGRTGAKSTLLSSLGNTSI